MVHFLPPAATSNPISSSSLSLSVIDNPDANCLVQSSNVTITCDTDGFPRPSVKFLKGRNPVTPGEGAFLRVTQNFADQVSHISAVLVAIFESL